MARGAAKSAKNKPYKAPSRIPIMDEAGTTIATTRPPAAPTMMQMIIAVRSEERMIYFQILCTSGGTHPMIRLMRPGMSLVRTRIADINRLHNIAGEEQFDPPVEEHAHLALQPRQLREVDAAPHQPGEQAGETHRLVSGQ